MGTILKVHVNCGLTTMTTSEFLELPPGTSIAPELGLFTAHMGWPLDKVVVVRVVGKDITGIVLVECVKTNKREWISRLGLTPVTSDKP